LKITKRDGFDIYEPEDKNKGDTVFYDTRENKSTTPTCGVEFEKINGVMRSRIICLVCKTTTSWTSSEKEREEFVHHICQVEGDKNRT